jgi:hypothetical protein
MSLINNMGQSQNLGVFFPRCTNVANPAISSASSVLDRFLLVDLHRPHQGRVLLRSESSRYHPSSRIALPSIIDSCAVVGCRQLHRRLRIRALSVRSHAAATLLLDLAVVDASYWISSPQLVTWIKAIEALSRSLNWISPPAAASFGQGQLNLDLSRLSGSARLILSAQRGRIQSASIFSQ